MAKKIKDVGFEKAMAAYCDDEIVDKIADDMEMERRRDLWTWRGAMLPADELVLSATIDHVREAARIFVTGEVDVNTITAAARTHLIAVNDAYCENKAGGEPLFVLTRQNTIRMTRFDPEFIWLRIRKDMFTELLAEESKRLSVYVGTEHIDIFDFYRCMVDAIKSSYEGEYILVPRAGRETEDAYQGVYLACLLLLGKPGYMDVHVSTHFAKKAAVNFLRDAVYIQLAEEDCAKLKTLRESYSGTKALTNAEMVFVVDLYQRALLCR
jgi:hypothetical protein